MGFVELFVNVIRSDKTEKFWESRTLFQKGFRRKAAFLFCEATQEQAFFFVPPVSKKKAIFSVCLYATFLFEKVGAKEKSPQKKNAVF